MSKILPTGIIQLSKTSDIALNRARLTEKIRELAARGAKLIVNQELHDSLYFCQTEDVDTCNLAISLDGEEIKHYSELAAECKVVLIISVFEKRAPGLYHNTAVVIDTDGSIAGKYRKMHIPDDPAFYEKFYFAPGDLGFEPVDTSVGRLGVLVCWDQWYPEAARIMALKGAELLIYPTAIGWNPRDDEEEKQRQLDAWITVQRGHAVANGIPVISVNRTGFESSPAKGDPGLQFWGNSFVAGPQGEILFKAPALEESADIVSIDMSRSEEVRRWWPFLRDRRIDAYTDITRRFVDNT